MRSHVGELKRAMTFTEEVVTSRSPHSLSYSQARGQLPRVFLPPLASDTTCRRPRVGREMGARDFRRHLCYLSGPGPPATHDRPAMSLSHPPPSLPPHVSHAPSCPSGMLYRKVKIFPPSQSVHWEGRLLAGVTSSTAARLGGGARGEGEEVIAVKSESVRGEEVKEGEQENYRDSLGKGAKPIWGRGRGDTIVLDNNTTFTKVYNLIGH